MTIDVLGIYWDNNATSLNIKLWLYNKSLNNTHRTTNVFRTSKVLSIILAYLSYVAWKFDYGAELSYERH